MSAPFALSDGILFTGETFVEGHALLIDQGKILGIVANQKIPKNIRTLSQNGKILAPGFIDAQINGGGNILYNANPTSESALAIALAHQTYGTTRLLLTCITDRPEITVKALGAMREARKQNRAILGLHIEGPHLSEGKRGVHKGDLLRGLSEQDIELYKPQEDEVILVTLAPECVAPDLIHKLHKQGTRVSLGHTQATADQTRDALKAGASCFTHLFNGMPPLSARGQNVTDVALDDRKSWCGLIADGHHVSPEMIRLALRSKPDQLFLVSDAMPPSATEHPLPFELYGETIQPDNGRCVNKEGKLAGAILTMGQAVHFCIKACGVTPEEALRMGSAIPAAFLGLDTIYGKLLPGYAADIVVLSTDFKVESVYTST